MGEGRAKMGPNQILLGNVNPVAVLRDGNPDTVMSAIAECHRQAGPRFIVSAGCEVTRDTPLDNVRAMGDYARNHSPASVSI
jgi:uroporphyrinogen-III decarboxylase